VGAGSYVLLGLLTIWSARASLGETWRRAVGRSPSARRDGEGADTNPERREPVPALLAFWGFWLTLVGLLAFCRILGLDLGVAFVMFATFLLFALVVSRLVSEAGLFVVWVPIYQEGYPARVFGVGNLGAQNITALCMINYRILDTCSLTLASILQGYKIGELARLHPWHLLVLICVALGLGILASHPTSLYSIYSRGVPALGWWPRTAATGLPRDISNLLQTPDQLYTAGNYGNMALGAAVTLLLTFMHMRYLWWPLHPLGWVAIVSLGVSYRYGFSFFLGWLLSLLAR